MSYEELPIDIQSYIGRLSQVPENDINYQLDYTGIPSRLKREAIRNYLYNIDDNPDREALTPYSSTLGLTLERSLSVLNNKEGTRQQKEEELNRIRRRFVDRGVSGTLISKTTEDIRKERLFNDIFGEPYNMPIVGVGFEEDEDEPPLSPRIGDLRINRPIINDKLVELGNEAGYLERLFNNIGLL
jgi:hypothetical protein